MKSKLEKIDKILRENKNIIIYKNEINRLDNPRILLDTFLAHIVNFRVIPKKSFETNKNLSENLNEFMNGLIPNLEPTEKDDFEQEVYINKKKKEMILLKMSQMYFDDNLEGGLIKTTLQLDNKIFEMSDKINYIRRIIVSPFPNKKVFEKYRDANHAGYISLEMKTTSLNRIGHNKNHDSK